MPWLRKLSLSLSLAWGVAMAMPLQPAEIRPSDLASLQRGAKFFMNYCSGCHSLQFMRYDKLGQDLSVSQKLLQENLVFAPAKLSDPIVRALRAEDAQRWFGVSPPDLTLIAKVRSPDWLYTFLHGFYQADDKPWGTDNLLFPGVAMPHALVSLQGIQRLSADERLSLAQPGLLSPQEYDRTINDIVNFLVYTAAPEKLARQYLGLWVLLFLTIFAILAYLLKRQYWKHIN
jgi:ubiquinol-cytochrome c reductase cytochrome c1 subunit